MTTEIDSNDNEVTETEDMTSDEKAALAAANKEAKLRKALRLVMSEYVSKTPDGHLDLETTYKKFTRDISKMWEQDLHIYSLVHKYVHAAFDKYPGAKTNMDFIIGQAIRGMDANGEKRMDGKDVAGPDHYAELQNQIRSYLQAGTEAGHFTITKGQGANGGIRRVKKPSDSNAKTVSEDPKPEVSAE